MKFTAVASAIFLFLGAAAAGPAEASNKLTERQNCSCCVNGVSTFASCNGCCVTSSALGTSCAGKACGT
ncbi:hypothetical protein CGMCC3_g11650 [Colletotrichum fructicola]|nr:uncharacterized protein CGMCC3_g11650 [Colletotrichum fructicola]KAE9572296.1 hypothetical protein CGMCC3_g11650 [Colletotrichum fructicola]